MAIPAIEKLNLSTMANGNAKNISSHK